MAEIGSRCSAPLEGDTRRFKEDFDAISAKRAANALRLHCSGKVGAPQPLSCCQSTGFIFYVVSDADRLLSHDHPQVSLPDNRRKDLEAIVLSYFSALEITPEMLETADAIEPRKAVDGW